MMQNLVCTAFLAAALAAEVPQAQPVSETTTTTNGLPSAHVIVEMGSSKSKVHVMPFNIENGTFSDKIQNKKEWYPKVMKKGKAKSKDYFFSLVNTEPGTNKSERTVEQGLAGACRTNDFNTDTDVCTKHMDAIKMALENANKEYNFLSVEFGGTAGLRQSPQGLQTIDDLKEHMQDADLPNLSGISKDNFTYRELSGEEEAENEFLSVDTVLKSLTPEANPAESEVNKVQAVIGFGGASLQYGIESGLFNSAHKEAIDVASVQGGAVRARAHFDKEWAEAQYKKTQQEAREEVEEEAEEEEQEEEQSEESTVVKEDKNPCEVHTGPSLKDGPQDKTLACKNEVKKVFDAFFKQEKFAAKNDKWASPDLSLYAVGGGITWAMRYDKQDEVTTQKNSWNHTIAELEKIQEKRCLTYEEHKVGDKIYREQGMPEEEFNKKLNLEPGEFNKYYKDACFKVTYFLNVLTHLGVTDKQTVIQIRKKFLDVHGPSTEEGKKKEMASDWVRAAAMKKVTPQAFDYDVASITDRAINSYAQRMSEYLESKAGPETLI